MEQVDRVPSMKKVGFESCLHHDNLFGEHCGRYYSRVKWHWKTIYIFFKVIIQIYFKKERRVVDFIKAMATVSHFGGLIHTILE